MGLWVMTSPSPCMWGELHVVCRAINTLSTEPESQVLNQWESYYSATWMPPSCPPSLQSVFCTPLLPLPSPSLDSLLPPQSAGFSPVGFPGLDLVLLSTCSQCLSQIRGEMNGAWDIWADEAKPFSSPAPTFSCLFGALRSGLQVHQSLWDPLPHARPWSLSQEETGRQQCLVAVIHLQ